MCHIMLAGTYFWSNVVSSGRQGSLLDGQGLESAYLQHDCFGPATVGRRIHQSLTLFLGYNLNCLVHTLGLHVVGALWGFCDCSYAAPESSFGSINWKSVHIWCRLCTGTSLQVIGIPVHEWNHHFYYNGQASYVFFYCCMISWFDSALGFPVVLCCFSLPVGPFFLLCLFVESTVYWCLIKLIWVACGSPATCLIRHSVALELSNFFDKWQTLLAGNIPGSTLPSVIVLDTKLSSHQKNQKMSQCNFFTFSGGYLVRFYLHLYSIVPFINTFVSLTKTG